MAEQYDTAGSLVKIAIKDGVLVRPEHCEECGLKRVPDRRGSKIVAHHYDYNNPLAVRWLCHFCHRKWHRNNEPANKGAKHLRTPPAEPVICRICDVEIDQENTKVKRQYHPACKRFRNFLDATVRAAREIVEEHPTDRARSNIRHEAFVASNRMGAILQRRDARGRFC